LSGRIEPTSQWYSETIGPAILIRSARQLLTLRGPSGPRRGLALKELEIIPDGALLLRDGLIQEVGPTRRLENLAAARDAIEIDATGKVVMPGLVDCHTHMMFPPPKAGEGEVDQDGARAIRALVSVTAQRLAARGRTYLKTMARHGTTTLDAKTGCGPHESAELKVLRVLNVLNKGPLDVIPGFLFRLGLPGEDGSRTDAAAAEWVFHEFLFKIRRRRLARFADLQWDTDMARRPFMGRFLDAALSLGFARRIHADQHSSSAAVSLAVEHAVTSIDHLEYATLDQARMLGGTDVIATLLPLASFRHGHHAPARSLIEAGVAVALGSNFNPRDCPSLSMQAAVSVACLQMEMSPAEAISAATINGAHVLGAAGRIGSLECDKLADVVVLNTSDHRDLAYQLGTNLVHTTIKRGEILCTM
jgi:imidazolonepropionase